MDILNIVLLLLIFLIFFLLGTKLFKTKKEVKAPKVKKEEIILEYEYKMQEILTKYKNDDAMLLKQKKILLKQISDELAMNIFFDQQEIKEVIQKLINMN